MSVAVYNTTLGPKLFVTDVLENVTACGRKYFLHPCDGKTPFYCKVSALHHLLLLLFYSAIYFLKLVPPSSQFTVRSKYCYETLILIKLHCGTGGTKMILSQKLNMHRKVF